MASIKDTYAAPPENVTFLNDYSRGFHIAKSNIDKDLFLTFCDLLGAEPKILTDKAVHTLRRSFKGVVTAVPIDAASAACLSDEVLTSEDIAELLK